ncbi:MAG: TonB-dependent receptor [Filimonas sp.]|nr:TonB-dependent receptor [Filimonas sp.]
MKKLSILLISLFTTTVLMAQVKISGQVKDAKGKPVIGASITLKDSYDGATSDSTGAFKFKTTEKGTFILIASAVSYKTVEQNIDLSKDVVANFSMKEEFDELRAVTVTAGSFSAGDSKRGTVLSSLDVLTTAGANADITAALKTLPGAQQVGEQEGLFVRGGAGYETKQFIDGTLVANPYFSGAPQIATRGRFSPTIFKGTTFSTGGYSALYGQALSSVVLLESIDLPERSEVNVGISPLMGSLATQQLAKDKKSSWGMSYSYANLDLYFKMVPQTPDYFKVPSFHNADANFRIKTKHGGFIKYYGTFAYNQLGLRRQDIDSTTMKDAFGLNSHNFYNNLTWRENLGSGWRMRLGVSYSTNLDDISLQFQNQNNQQIFVPTVPYSYKNAAYKNRLDVTQGRAEFEKRFNSISTIRFGSEYWYNYNKQTVNNKDSLLTDNYNALFGEANIYLTNDLGLTAGGRVEYSSIIKKFNFAPRAALAYRVGKGAQVSLAYGQFYQKPENNLLFPNPNLGYTKATHYIANYMKTTEGRLFRVEAYYKTYEDLVKTYPAPFSDNSGSGYARGAELYFRDKKSIKNFDYWVSYSYLDTKRDYLNFPEKMTPNFAATHTASVVLKRFVMDWKTGFGATYSFATGRPYYNIMQNGGKYQVTDQGKTKDFNNLGLTAYYVPTAGNTKAKTFWVVVASVTNILGTFGQEQVYGYNYSYNGLNKVAVTPPAKNFYFVGVFLSWGVDRTDDIVNNNL